jgi:membrane fusion protein (multidrug efflux system)
VQEDVPVVSEWVATLDGYVNAQIQAQVAGHVVAQKYQEGLLVRQPFFSAAQLPKFGKHGLVQ